MERGTRREKQQGKKGGEKEGQKKETRQSYLSHQLLVDGPVLVWPIERLLDEGKEDGYNDDSLQCLSEDDEEHGN